ncbi:hypothetical protein [Paraburkholderia ginsengisoli]|uniref:hypothetical protein n=2 Tax=Paraburkholderia ginsengisoli TaxID=311231 RepID=UPI0020D16FC2|nr:hypothetical protein [Paraburkholderia ginsengisoli]
MNPFRTITRATGRLALTGSLLLTSVAFGQGVLAPPEGAGPRNSLVYAANAVGVRQCMPALTALSALGVQGTTNNDVLFDWDRTRAGASTVFSLIGLELPGANAAMSITGVPEADGSCSVSAERISVAPVSCPALARKELVGYQATKLLPHMMVYTDAKDLGSSVSLIDQQASCLVIRRYVKFSAGAAAPIR